MRRAIATVWPLVALARPHRMMLLAGAAMGALAISASVGLMATSGYLISRAALEPPILSLTPAELAGGALGTSYALSPTPTSPTTASVLRSMSPETRRYTRAVMALTFAQLAAGAAGSP